MEEQGKRSIASRIIHGIVWLILISVIYFAVHAALSGSSLITELIDLKKLMEFRLLFFLLLPSLGMYFLSLLLYCVGLGLLLSRVERIRIYGMLMLLISIVLNEYIAELFPFFVAPFVIVGLNAGYNKLINGRALKGGLIPPIIACVVTMSYLIGISCLFGPQKMPGPLQSFPIAFIIIPSMVILVALLYQRTGMIPMYLRAPRPLPKIPKRSQSRGVTLIEMLIVIAILSITVPALLHSVRPAMAQTAKSRDARQATQLVRNVVEKFRLGELALEEGAQYGETELSGPTAMVTVGVPQENGLVPIFIEVVIGPDFIEETLRFTTLLRPVEETP